MHYDLASDARLAWASFPYFLDWAGMVGHGDCGFVRTGFVQIVPGELAANVRANVAAQQAIGIDTGMLAAADLARLVPGVVTDDVTTAIYEPRSGYADPSGTAAGFLAAARALGARVIQGCSASAVLVDGDGGRRRRDRSRHVRRPGRRRRRRRVGGGARAHGRRRDPGRGLAPRHRLLRSARRARHGLPDRHRRDQRGLLPARGQRDDAGRARGRQRGRRLARPPARDAAPGHRRGDGPPGLRPRAVDGGRHAADQPRRPGRHHARPARDPRSGRAGRLLPRLRVLGDRLQDGAGHRPLPDRADPRRPGDDRRHRRATRWTVSRRAARSSASIPYRLLWH